MAGTIFKWQNILDTKTAGAGGVALFPSVSAILPHDSAASAARC